MEPAAQTVDDSLVGQRAMRRITWRLMPFLCLLFIVNYLDRTNVAMAKLPMVKDHLLTDLTYGTGAGVFFISYCLFEVPSNLILHRVGARRWIARIMITWGLCSAAMMLTRGAWSFYTIRFLLGIAEAGFFPGIVFYLMHWIPQRQRARALSVFLTSTATSGVIGTPLAGLIMKMDGMASLHGWQWLFLLEGIPPILLGVAILWMQLLPDRPADAHWLAADERDWIEGQLEHDGTHQAVEPVAHLRSAAMDGRLWLLSAIYFMVVAGLYGFVYWSPTLIKRLNANFTDAEVGLLTAIPYLVGAATMILVGKIADRSSRRRATVAACAVIGGVGLLLLCNATTPTTGIAALSVAAIGIFGTLGPFWAIPTRYLRGAAAAGGIAIINSTGAIAGYFAPSAIGWAISRNADKSPTWGLVLVAAALATGAILVMCVPRRIDTQHGATE